MPEKNWHITGIEPNATARKNAKRKGVELLPSLEDVQKKKFSVITLWHVLEHLHNPIQQLNSLKALLEPNGILIVAVPNYKSYDAKKYQEYWAAYDVPRHLYHFSQDAIKNLAKETGFMVERTKPMFFDSFYVAMLSEQYKNKSSNYIKAFGVGLVSNLKALFSSEYSSIIYVLRPKQ